MDHAIITTTTNGDSFGVLWMIGWIFTIGYLKLSFWRGALALVIWPYYLGVKFRKEHHTTHHAEHTTVNPDYHL